MAFWCVSELDMYGTVTSYPKYVFCALSCTAFAVHYTIFQATQGC
jgi:hypothetical protein